MANYYEEWIPGSQPKHWNCHFPTSRSFLSRLTITNITHIQRPYVGHMQAPQLVSPETMSHNEHKLVILVDYLMRTFTSVSHTIIPLLSRFPKLDPVLDSRPLNLFPSVNVKSLWWQLGVVTNLITEGSQFRHPLDSRDFLLYKLSNLLQMPKTKGYWKLKTWISEQEL